jgi:phage shock protein PspC (stress-responsive transcriptional regulator)
MNKVININFQGSIIPIEETASELLRNYVNSLRQYFAQEEGRDEIISDIESRIVELFLQKLKKGALCITDNDMKEIMGSIGHPDDLQAAEAVLNDHSDSSQRQESNQNNDEFKVEQKRLYRASNNQVVGGVAAGLGAYLGIDPSIMRVIFVFCLFAGFGFIVYLVLWAVLPEKEVLVAHVRKRLFRNPEDKKIGGVASGIAAYLDIDVWIPRLIFLLPLILGTLGEVWNHNWLRIFHVSHFIFGGFGGSLFIVYLVLWAVLPEANTAAEKLQMRGEKIDLESIKKTVHDEMQNLKGRAEQWSKEASKRATEKAKMMKGDLSSSAQNFTRQTNNTARRTGSGLGNAIGVLAKVFVFGVLSLIIISLLIGFVSVSTWLFTGHQIVDFILVDESEKILLWATLILFIGVPIIAILMWLVRIIRGVQSRNKYVGYMFTFLHILGWVSFFALLSFVGGHFNSKSKQATMKQLSKPTNNLLYVTVDDFEDEDLIDDWHSDTRWPHLNKMEDSIYSANIKIKVVQSKDSMFYIKVLKRAHGENILQANGYANSIQYSLFQQDSILHLSKYLSFSKKDKFHLQQLMLVIEVPLGSKIKLSDKIKNFAWNEVSITTGRGFKIEHHGSDDGDDYETDKEYLMSTNGLQVIENQDVDIQ